MKKIVTNMYMCVQQWVLLPLYLCKRYQCRVDWTSQEWAKQKNSSTLICCLWVVIYSVHTWNHSNKNATTVRDWVILHEHLRMNSEISKRWLVRVNSNRNSAKTASYMWNPFSCRRIRTAYLRSPTYQILSMKHFFPTKTYTSKS